MKLKELDFKTAGFWPEKTKKIAYAMVFVFVVLIGWFLLLSPKHSDLKGLEEQEKTLMDEYTTVQTKANNLAVLKEELNQINDLLKTLATQLPNKNEIPELVVNVSQAALANGLQVDLFQPQDETKHEFYAEKRINVNFKGDYHNLGSFFSEVAQQPRLISVVVEGMKMTIVPKKKEASSDNDTNMELDLQKDPTLTFEGTVRTYRYLSDDEEAEVAKQKKEEEDKKNKKKGKKATPKAEDAPKAE